MYYRARSWDSLTERFDRSGFRVWPSKLRPVARAMSSRHGHCEVFAFKTRQEARTERESAIVEIWYEGKIFESRLLNPKEE